MRPGRQHPKKGISAENSHSVSEIAVLPNGFWDRKMHKNGRLSAALTAGSIEMQRPAKAFLLGCPVGSPVSTGPNSDG
jgi:hypothetical protein